MCLCLVCMYKLPRIIIISFGKRRLYHPHMVFVISSSFASHFHLHARAAAAAGSDAIYIWANCECKVQTQKIYFVYMKGSSNQFWEIKPFNFDGVESAMANAFMQPYNYLFFFLSVLFGDPTWWLFLWSHFFFRWQQTKFEKKT